jgi:hypothetical protein
MVREKLKTKLQRFIEERLVIDPEKTVQLGVWALGTVVCHNLNLAGMVNWFGRPTDRIDTGLPGPFRWRRRFPWEREENKEPTLEDKICEWGIPAITSWMLVYHPDAIARFVDAMIPL